MSGYCTCGALLPPDARFCHKCGKPQFELPEPELLPVLEAQPQASATAPAAAPSISLRNPMAVRAAFLAGAGTSFLLMVPLPTLLQVLWQLVLLVASGFFSVWLYKRRTGLELNVRSGAHLGWLAGSFCFLIMLVLFTVSVVALATGEGLERGFTQMLEMRGSPAVAQQMESILASPAGIGGLLLAMIISSWLMLSLCATVGGALGAKVLDKE